MKPLFALAGLFLLTFAPLAASSLSSDELERARDHLESTRDTLLAETAGLSDAQWNFKPAPDRWSVGEVVEHLAAAEDFLMTMVRDQVMQAPPRATAEDMAAIDAFVLKAIPDRSNRVKAPEPLIPAGRFGSRTDTLKQLKDNRAKTIAFLEQTNGLRDHAVESPLGKNLDAYQWILFVSAHAERHTKQIQEVKADPNFPKS